MQNHYLVLAYYALLPLTDPHLEVVRHKAFFEGRDATARIYLSEQGINGQMSAVKADALAYMEWLHADARFRDVEFKIQTYHENIFPRLTIKYRKQLVALDTPVDVSARAEHLSPADWKAALEQRDENTLVLDVRNDYEWQIGHFEGSVLPECANFREFPKFVEALKEQRDTKKTKVLMCCTGGIRCEFFSPLLKQAGFEQVYQLQGGIIKYGQEFGSEHWKGKLFVFDDRLAVDLGPEASAPIGTCWHCGCSEDTYHNCANMDCNELFISCSSCWNDKLGCCCAACIEAPRRREIDPRVGNKPFRRQSCTINEDQRRDARAPKSASASDHAPLSVPV